MSRLMTVAFAAMIFLLSANPVQERFAKYRAIEAYEVRPGILMMPRYSADKQVCEIGLEKLHYSPEVIRLDSSLSRKEIDQIVDELVPAEERGPRSKEFVGTLITRSGPSLTMNIDFENVWLQIHGRASNAPGEAGTTVDWVAATIKWKNRKCQ